MLKPDGSKKTPDFRVHQLGVPAVIECKRRNRITDYEIREARHVETLYDAVRPHLIDKGIHVSIEVEFSSEIFKISPDEFRSAVLLLLSNDAEGVDRVFDWGAMRYKTLRYICQLPLTRLYSPLYLDRVFDWSYAQQKWDGILCEVESPPAMLLYTAKSPRCLKWASLSPDAILKKSRGVTSLWGDAVRQISDGEMGFVYISYTEGSRPELADARTQYIKDKATEWYHRWSVMVPLTIINRVYPLSSGPGMPDLIENVIPLPQEGDEHFLQSFPTLVLVPSAHNAE
jgi:hypothetical protein